MSDLLTQIANKMKRLESENESLRAEVDRQRKMNKTIAHDVLKGAKAGYEERLASLEAEVERLPSLRLEILALKAELIPSDDKRIQAIAGELQRFADALLSKESKPCAHCGGSGLVDSGGFDPNTGDGIDVPCQCQKEGER